MSLSDEITDLIDTGYLGEAVTIVRNTPTYSDTGTFTDSWASTSTPNAEIQPIGGDLSTMPQGQQAVSTHRIHLPNGNGVRAGDRVRPSGWSTGDDEYEVDVVLTRTGHHVEALLHKVVGHG